MDYTFIDKVENFFSFLGKKDRVQENALLAAIFYYEGAESEDIHYLVNGFDNEVRSNLLSIPTRENQQSHLVHVIHKIFRLGCYWHTAQKVHINKYFNQPQSLRNKYFSNLPLDEKYLIVTFIYFKEFGKIVKSICEDFNINSFDIFSQASMAEHFFSPEEIAKEQLRVFETSSAKNDDGSSGPSIKKNKIKWLGEKNQFGYLFLELTKKGFIEPPISNGEPNFTALARLCYEYFEFDGKFSSLEKELRESSCSLSETKRAKFTIPELSDLK